MNADLIARLRAQLGGPRDGALLRFSLGTALLSNGDACGAITAFREAVGFDAGYSAAWKMLGKALADAGDAHAAADAYREGLSVAQRRGDKQVEREISVFLRRLEKSQAH
jgi:Tfp pilus assembly protein PilF